MGSKVALGTASGQILQMQDPWGAVEVVGSVAGLVRDLAWSPDGRYLLASAASPSQSKMIDTQEGSEQLMTTDNVSNGCDFSPDGSLFAVVTAGAATFYVYTTADVQPVAGASANKSISGGYAARFSPDGTMLAIGGYSGVNANVDIFNVADWTKIATLTTLNSSAVSLAWSPDGQELAVLGANKWDISVFSTSGWGMLGNYPAQRASTGGPSGIAYSPDSALCAITSEDAPHLAVCDTATRELVAGSPSLPTDGTSVDFSKDGSLLFAGTEQADGLRIFSTADWSLVGGVYVSGEAITAVRVSENLDLPARRVKVRDYSGAPIAGVVRALAPDNMRVIAHTVTAADGSGTLRAFKGGPMVAVVLDDSATAMDHAVESFSLGSESDPELELYLGYSGTPATMSGRVTVSTGGPADEVVIRAWASRKLVARVYPDSNGDWTAQVPPGEYDVTYIKAGCAPVVHGPYTVAAA